MNNNANDFVFECLASFGPIDVEIHGEEIFVVCEELG